MNRLLIIGAGAFGREVLNWAQDVSLQNQEWEVGGFLDANPAALNGYDCKFPILADPLTYLPCQGDYFICAIGHTATKLYVCRHLKGRGAQFITLIHPAAVIGNRCSIGEGCIFCPGAIVTTDVKISDFVTVNIQASIGHDAVIGEGCTLSGHVDITGFASLGEGVFLGSHAVVLPKAKVGDYAIVGAGSVVLKRVKAGTTVMGVPAKQVAGF
jgi:sugar O-acyltransferase (sialic acid O-acetyltransferase NeuD family)